MNMTQVPVERRQQPRFKAAEGVFAALVNHNSKLGQIRDNDYNKDAYELIKKNAKLNDVNFEIKNEHRFSSIKMCQIGLQFGKLTTQQRIRLELFIQKHTTGEA